MVTCARSARAASAAIVLLAFLGLSTGSARAASFIIIPSASAVAATAGGALLGPDEDLIPRGSGVISANSTAFNSNLLQDINLSATDCPAVARGRTRFGFSFEPEHSLVGGDTDTCSGDSPAALLLPTGVENVFVSPSETVPEISRVVLTTCSKGDIDCDPKAFSVDALLLKSGVAAASPAWRPATFILLFLSLGFTLFGVFRRV